MQDLFDSTRAEEEFSKSGQHAAGGRLEANIRICCVPFGQAAHWPPQRPIVRRRLGIYFDVNSGTHPVNFGELLAADNMALRWPLDPVGSHPKYDVGGSNRLAEAATDAKSR